MTASVEYLGPHAAPLRDGLQTLQRAFRETSAVPDMMTGTESSCVVA